MRYAATRYFAGKIVNPHIRSTRQCYRHFRASKRQAIQTVFETGARREVSDGKGRFDLIPAYPMKRLAVHYANGGAQVRRSNWEKGLPSTASSTAPNGI